MAKHVLVPLDGSEPAWKALEYALENVEADRLTVLYVVDPVDSIYSSTEDGYYSPELFEQAVERGEKLCEEARERIRAAAGPDSPDVETATEVGRPARTIVDYASEHDVDRVVMGSHGRTGASRILLGSVAETVTRRVGLPVTIVR